MQTQGKKEIQEAVITAALVTIATGVIGIGFEFIKRALFAKKEEPKPTVTSAPVPPTP